ncbi:MAG: hypothetical protein IJQ31_16455, partial [Thermoguttaceae bacterium]|nr:hypothetical protein [Thermoguttaceae bacterium]
MKCPVLLICEPVAGRVVVETLVVSNTIQVDQLVLLVVGVDLVKIGPRLFRQNIPFGSPIPQPVVGV